MCKSGTIAYDIGFVTLIFFMIDASFALQYEWIVSLPMWKRWLVLYLICLIWFLSKILIIAKHFFVYTLVLIVILNAIEIETIHILNGNH